jgi:hypothetical protein
MNSEQRIWTFDEVSVAFVRKSSGYIANRYRHWSIDSDDIASEIHVWLYGKGTEKVQRWLANEPQQTTRIYRSMLDKGLEFAEKEKASKVGYHVDDVHWYTPSAIEGLMPLVLDPTYVQEKGVIGDLITMVLDIRRVMTPDDVEWFTDNDPDDEHVRVLVDRLGGARPYVGRRRVISNAPATAITSEQT